MSRESLPIDTLLPEIVASLARTPNLVIEAPPGAGKTTRVPAALLEAEDTRGEVWVLEPRRLATRLAARRVAEERGERVGEIVGYQVRFEDVSSTATRLRFLTEGVFTRRLLSDPQLAKVGAVFLDEFHERHLQADLALALLRRLQRRARPDLRIVAMSATLAAAPLANFLGACPTLRSEGRRFPVEIEHLPRHDERPLAQQVAAALKRLLTEKLDGDVLVFLPGAAEIRRAQEACAELSEQNDLLLLPLHGDLPAAEQDRVVRPADRRKVILSTNVAETSVTIEGVAAVIDSGLARIAGHSAWTGLPTLNVARISRASAIQRAGRAGRTRAGRCLRLYTAPDFAARPEHETAEIERLDLAETALELHAAGIRNLQEFDWFEAPPLVALSAADALLRRLGAIDESGGITLHGQRMLKLPLHPRLARLVVEAEARGVADEGCLIAALLSERDIRARQMFSGTLARQSSVEARTSGSSDLLEQSDLFLEAEGAGFAAEILRRMNLDPGAVRAVARVKRQLESALRRKRKATIKEVAGTSQTKRESEILISILAGFPDRVARPRNATANEGRQSEGVELLLAGGGGARLAPESVVRQAEFLVAVEAEERREGSRASQPGSKFFVRLASAIEPEWLLDLFTDAIRETLEVRWNALGERVEAVSQMLYDQLVLDERPAAEISGAEVSRVLAEAALAAGPENFIAAADLERFRARVAFVAGHFPAAQFPALTATNVRHALAELCEGRRSFAELREAARAGALLNLLRCQLNNEQTRLLETTAPEQVRLTAGRRVRVQYEAHQPPWIASRLQDFFGMKEGPTVAGGRVPLTLRLLAPNNRPVQITSDLAGFWARAYPQLRRELSRRYPRHAWPENPLQPADAPERKSSR